MEKKRTEGNLQPETGNFTTQVVANTNSNFAPDVLIVAKTLTPKS